VREAEESPLLETVAREWLVKTAGWEGLAGADLLSVEINDSAVITCNSKWCEQVVSKSNSPNPYPVYSHTPLKRDSMRLKQMQSDLYLVTLCWLHHRNIQRIN
jgi:hypothetical protein